MLERICSRWSGCKQCVLHLARTTVVVGEGAAPAKLMMIGEGPGAEEDRTGRPFVGPAGQLLRNSAVKAGIDMAQTYITNIVACRPPENRTPMPDEIEECKPRLDALVAVVQPRAILLLGGTALTVIMAKSGITKHRGKWAETRWLWRGVWTQIPTTATFHPAGLLPGRLRSPEDMALFMADLGAAAERANQA